MFQSEPTSNPKTQVENPYKALADAIRRGAQLTRQCAYTYYSESCGTVFTCALGAAVFGIGQQETPDVFVNTAIMQLFPVLTLHLANQITYMNDKARFSREAIADWVESLGV